MNPEQIAEILRALQILEASDNPEDLEQAAAIRAQIERDPLLQPAAEAVRNNQRLSDNTSQIDKALERLESAGPAGQARAADLRQAQARRQQVADFASSRGQQVSDIATGLSTPAYLARQGLGTLVDSVSDTLSSLPTRQGPSSEGAIPSPDGSNPGLIQAIQDFISPEDQAQAALAQLTPGAAPTVAQPVAPASLPAGAEVFPGTMQLQQLAAAGALQPNPDPLGLQAQRAQIAAAIQAQAQSTVAQQEMARLNDQIRLQVTPQLNPATLNAAAVLATPAPVSQAPAGIGQTLSQAQAVAPQVTLPSLQAAGQTNIRQRLSTERTQQAANSKLMREQERALEIAREQYINDLLIPVFSRPR